MHPIIGITMSCDKHDLIRKGVQYSYIRREYGRIVREAGAQPVFLDSSIDPMVAAKLCRGIIISGGEDIDPAFYGQETRTTGIIEPRERTVWEKRLIDACDGNDVSILGICYGSQLLNIHYGGTLYQDIAIECGSTLDHGSAGASSMHKVAFERDFLGYSEGEIVESASRHHQAVSLVAPGFEVVARAEDGVVEAISGRGHYGVQWHSESDRTGGMIYRAFVEECVSRRHRTKYALFRSNMVRSLRRS